jgi:hypothetical protein
MEPMPPNSLPANDILLTGIPRSGTTLTCALFNKVPNTVALNEPMDAVALSNQPNDEARCLLVARFLVSQRQSILTAGRATATGIDGCICDNVVSAPINGARHYLASCGEQEVPRPTRSDFYLLIKHPAIFTVLLRSLPSRFPVYAFVRNPLAVVGSLLSLSDTPKMGVARGRLPLIERLDPELGTALASMPDLVDRLIFIVSWFCGQFLKYLPPEHVVRYEDIVATGGRALARIVPKSAELNEALESRNNSKFYGEQQLQRVCKCLIATDGKWRAFYSNDDILQLMEKYRATGSPLA